MKLTAPTVPPIKQGKEPKSYMQIIYAIGTMALIIMWSYIISKI